MRELYDQMRERMAYLEAQEQTDEIIWRRKELTLTMVKVQQLLLSDIKGGVDETCDNCGKKLTILKYCKNCDNDE